MKHLSLVLMLLLTACPKSPGPQTFDASLNVSLAASKTVYLQLEKIIDERISAGRVGPKEARTLLTLTEKFEETHGNLQRLAHQYVDLRDLVETSQGDPLILATSMLQAVTREIEGEQQAIERVTASLRDLLIALGELQE